MSKDGLFKWISDRCNDPRFLVRVATASDLQDIANLDSAYGDHSVDISGLTAWHTRYRDGAYVICYRADDKSPWEVIGSLGIWPVTAEAFEGIVSGHIKETDLGASAIMPYAQHAQYPHWYVGGVTLRADFRQKTFIGERKGLSARPFVILMQYGLEDWLRKNRFADSIQVCAIQAGEIGGKLAMKFGFTACVDKDNQPVRTPLGEDLYRATFAKSALNAYHRKQSAKQTLHWIRDRVLDYAVRIVLAAALGALLATGLSWIAGERIDVLTKFSWRPWLYIISILGFLWSLTPSPAMRKVVLALIVTTLGVAIERILDKN